MKITSLKFFSPKENSKPVVEKKVSKPTILKGYISPAGKLVFPDKTVDKLGFDPSNTHFKIGSQAGKRKLSSLYLVPATSDESDVFKMTKAAKSYSIPLGIILNSGGVDYATTKYSFIINSFEYEGVTAYELQLVKDQGSKQSAEKPAYTGKPRGRKPKVKDGE
ncbi:hypothetical protein DR864_21485 [Runella rosea]|uniref:Uncharacterized protein n=1 Tax=Runella rosea TaxID=2259595 RepID=A0A344TNB6_9BACT|nr:hypothetical protein [Runella rosea]AXE20137.1 hypothetical protein DR864_21485 [Runella rosea]